MSARIDRFARWIGVGVLLLAGLARPDPVAAQCNGNLDLVPMNLPANIVRFRRAMQVAANVSTNPSRSSAAAITATLVLISASAEYSTRFGFSSTRLPRTSTRSAWRPR